MLIGPIGEFEYGEGDFSRGSAPPVQDTGADGLKLAPAPLYERLSGCPDAVPILAARDEIVVEREEADAEKVKAQLEQAMVDGKDGVINTPEVQGPHVSLGRNSEATTWEFRETGDEEPLWQARFARIAREYCQIEKLASPDLILGPFGFKVPCLPIKIQDGSGGWCRAAALV